MTRDEAIKKLYSESLQATGINRADFLTSYSNVAGFVDALAALGLLRLETKEDEAVAAARSRLETAHVCIIGGTGMSGWQNVGRLGPDGAAEIIDVLTKSGFRITRDK